MNTYIYSNDWRQQSDIVSWLIANLDLKVIHSEKSFTSLGNTNMLINVSDPFTSVITLNEGVDIEPIRYYFYGEHKSIVTDRLTLVPTSVTGRLSLNHPKQNHLESIISFNKGDVVPSFADPYAWEEAKMVQELLKEKGYDLTEREASCYTIGQAADMPDRVK